MAYTYLLGWSTLNRFYYGVRYAKGCHPDELCKTYFSSSKLVKSTIKDYGLPDIIEIRKVFDSVADARLWEHKVLRRLYVVSKDNWLNKTDNISISPKSAAYAHTIETRIKKSLSHKGKKHSEETKRKMSAAQKGKPRNYLKGKSRPEHAILMKNLQKEFGGFAAKKQKYQEI